MEKYILKIHDKAKELISLLGFNEDPIVTQKEKVFLVRFQLEEPNFLIGRQGETLEALQHVLRLLLNRELELDDRLVVIDINGYREKRTKNIEQRARELVYKVRETGKDVEIPFLNSYERRLVHSVVSAIADVESISEGEGYERKIIIKKK